MIAPTRWFSLRRRLIVWLLGGITVGWLAATGVVYVEARHELAKLHDRETRHARNDDGDTLRREFDEHFIETLLTPLLFGLPLLGGWIWFAIWRGLKPLDEVTVELGKRAPERLDPVMPVAAPREVRPLLEALNALFARVDQAMEKERAFTAEAAHELRTPLAAIATQAQVATRARDAAERDHALAQLSASARRASHLVEQLLTLARLDPAGGKVGVGVTARTLVVSDSGPGIPAEKRADALRRLHRLAGQEIEGSGLGLSIVARIVELHGATLELTDGIGQPGLTVQVRFSP